MLPLKKLNSHWVQTTGGHTKIIPASMGQRLPGCNRFWTVVVSRFATKVSCWPSLSCCLAYHRAPSWVPSCFCCTPLSCSRSLPVPDSPDIHMPTTLMVYISAPVSSASISVQRFVACVERVDEWMKNNRLRMNADKTQLLWLGTRQQLNKLTTTDLSLSSTRVKLSSSVLDLGVYIDSQLTTVDHVAALRRSCLYQLRQLRMIRSSLTLEAAKTLVHAFISSRLDYCNSLLYGVSDSLLAKL